MAGIETERTRFLAVADEVYHMGKNLVSTLGDYEEVMVQSTIRHRIHMLQKALVEYEKARGV